MNSYDKIKLTLLLFSRLLLFAFFQALIAIILQSWSGSEKYWLLTATLTNIVSIFILKFLLQMEGVKYLSIFRVYADTWKKDLLLFLGLAIISIPIVLLPNYFLNKLFYGSSTIYSDILFQPISKALIYILLLVFPLTIAFAELATYFGYIMPKLKSSVKSQAIVILIPAFFLSIQHCSLPLVFQFDFILYRGLVYLPFAILIGTVLYYRPSLLPYFAIFHALLDSMTVVMLINTIK